MLHEAKERKKPRETVPDSKSRVQKWPHVVHEGGAGGGGDGTSAESAGVEVGGGVRCRVACQR